MLDFDSSPAAFTNVQAAAVRSGASLFAASGSHANPVGDAISSLTFGKFGLPTPGAIKIPANSIPVGGNVGYVILKVSAEFLRTGTAAGNNCTVWLGPTNSPADQTLANPGMDATNGETAGFDWYIMLTSTTVESHARGWKTNSGGTDDVQTGGTFNPAIDNYLSIGTNNLNTADSLALVGLDVTAIVNTYAAQGGVMNSVYGNPAITTYVPPDFFGLCSASWPWDGAAVGTPPTFPVGRLSNYDNPKTHWNNLHQSANTINWTNLDTWVTNAKAAGIKKGIYVLYGTPQFLASSGGTVAAPYGTANSVLSGGGAYPNFGDATLAQLTYFCTQLALRNKTTYGGFFDVISLWNEPDFLQNPGSSSFWWGSKTQFVDTLFTAYTAFKGTDSTLTIYGPGTYSIVDANTGLNQWINQAGTLNPTKHGYDCFDNFASHPYHARPFGYSGNGDIQGLQLGGILSIRNTLLGTSKAASPIGASEYGVSSTAGAELTAFLAKPALYREAFIQRLWVDAMLSGMTFMTAFSYGNAANLMGNLSTDDPGSISALRKVYNACAGKTIINKLSGLMPDGTRKVVFTDGTTYQV